MFSASLWASHGVCPNNCFKVTPTRYASDAAMAPTKNVVRPERHQDEVDHRLLSDPIATNTMPVSIIDSMRDC